jgi:hypothetical protein
MQALRVLVVVMGVMIVAGTVTLGVLLAQKLGGGGAPAAVAGPVLLDEPTGTRIAGAEGTGDTVVLRLEGGGPDRVVVVDARAGRVVGRIGLSR